MKRNHHQKRKRSLIVIWKEDKRKSGFQSNIDDEAGSYLVKEMIDKIIQNVNDDKDINIEKQHITF